MQALPSLTDEVHLWTPGVFREEFNSAQQQRHDRHASHERQEGGAGGGGGDDASRLSTSRGVSEMAARSIKFVKHLGQGQFGFVIEVVCPMDGARHAVKLARNVSHII